MVDEFVFFIEVFMFDVVCECIFVVGWKCMMLIDVVCCAGVLRMMIYWLWFDM